MAQLGDWVDREGLLEEAASAGPEAAVDLVPQVAAELRAAESYGLEPEELDWLRLAARLDEKAWRREFGVEHDPAALKCEANIFRYRKLLQPLIVYVGAGASLRDVVREKLAALRTGSPVTWVAAPGVAETAATAGIPVRAATPEQVAGLIAGQDSARVRVLGSVPEILHTTAARHGAVILDAPVVAEGRRELLPFLLEQAISVTMHRFGLATNTGKVRADL